MPVDGLPPALECALITLINNSPLTSFKIDGRGDNTVIVLRFQANQQNNNMATQAHYRIKPPSQLARDRRRAEQRKEQVGDSSTSPSSLFLSTPPITTTETNPSTDVPNYHSNSIGLLHVNKTGRTFHRDAAPIPARAARDLEIGLQSTNACVVNCEQLIDTAIETQALEEENDNESSVAVSAEPPPGTKEYIGSIVDKAVLRRLKDRRRNHAFRKIVLDYLHPDRLLLCDSDDIVVMFNCTTRRVHHWFIKQPNAKLVEVERSCLDHLKRWEPPDGGLDEHDVIEATNQLAFLSSVIRDLLA